MKKKNFVYIQTCLHTDHMVHVSLLLLLLLLLVWLFGLINLHFVLNMLTTNGWMFSNREAKDAGKTMLLGAISFIANVPILQLMIVLIKTYFRGKILNFIIESNRIRLFSRLQVIQEDCLSLAV